MELEKIGYQKTFDFGPPLLVSDSFLFLLSPNVLFLLGNGVYRVRSPPGGHSLSQLSEAAAAAQGTHLRPGLGATLGGANGQTE